MSTANNQSHCYDHCLEHQWQGSRIYPIYNQFSRSLGHAVILELQKLNPTSFHSCPFAPCFAFKSHLYQMYLFLKCPSMWKNKSFTNSNACVSRNSFYASSFSFNGWNSFHVAEVGFQASLGLNRSLFCLELNPRPPDVIGFGSMRSLSASFFVVVVLVLLLCFMFSLFFSLDLSLFFLR